MPNILPSIAWIALATAIVLPAAAFPGGALPAPPTAIVPPSLPGSRGTLPPPTPQPPVRGGRTGRGPVVPVTPTTPPPALPAALPETTPPPATAPTDPFTIDLLARLNSADAAQKEAAQKQLAAIAGFWNQPELLKKMAEATSDLELKSVIQDRLNELQAKQAQLDITNLPPISLNVNGANITDLMNAFNTAFHVPAFSAAATRRGPVGGGNYTLDMKNKPFWEIFVALSQQQPLSLSSSTAGTSLINSGTGIRRYAIDGPAIGYVNSLNYQRSANLQTPNGDSPSSINMSAQVVIAVDPRVRVLRMATPTLLSAVDDAGRNLGGRSAGGGFSTGSNMLNYSLQFSPPETFGKSMTIKFDTRLTAGATELVGSIKDVENNANGSVTVGNRTFTVQRFTTTGTTISLQVGVSNNQPVDSTMRPTAVLYDGASKILWTYSLLGTISTSLSPGASTGPYRLEFRVPDKTIEIPVHFELKDVPLP